MHKPDPISASHPSRTHWLPARPALGFGMLIALCAWRTLEGRPANGWASALLALIVLYLLAPLAKTAGASKWVHAYLAIVAFSVMGLVISSVARIQAPVVANLASAAQLVAGLGALGSSIRERSGLAVAWKAIGGIVLFGFLVEIVGVRTGVPFGRYEYTGAWWPSVWIWGHFPLMVPAAWALVVGACYLVGERAVGGAWAAPFAALLASGIDLVMEPVMTGRLGYWKWLDSTWPWGGPLLGGAPVMNFVGWFATSWLISLALRWARIHVESPAPRLVILGHLALLGFVWVLA